MRPGEATPKASKESQQVGPWLAATRAPAADTAPQPPSPRCVETHTRAQTRERGHAHMRINSGDVVSRGNRMQDLASALMREPATCRS